MKKRICGLLLAAAFVFSVTGCGQQAPDDTIDMLLPDWGDTSAMQAPGMDAPGADEVDAATDIVADADIGGSVEWGGFTVPAWDGVDAVYELNGGVPLFGDDVKAEPAEAYSELDGLGRCGEAYAVVCHEIQPVEARGEIGSVKPSGWHTVRYNGLVPGNYLYNRCHLVGYQLAGENANEKNLVTGTRYLNIEGMLPYEDMVDDHLEDFDHHVAYRVTPVFLGSELVCRGVAMEGLCLDCGDVRFFVFAYNVQPGVGIDYMTGDSWRLDGQSQEEVEQELDEGPAEDFVLNTSSGKFHRPECASVGEMNPENLLEMHEPLSKMLEAGYSPCGQCNPDE